MFSPKGTRLAICATVVFTAAAVAGALWTVRDVTAALPLLGFHALLLIQTFFSIRCFSSIGPRPTAAQILIDGALVVLYLYLPFQFADATRFLSACIALFLIATFKYALMLGTPGYTRRLKIKMILDVLAAATCGLALAGVTVGLTQSLAWWLGVFLLANIYILLVSRVYFPAAEERPSRSVRPRPV